MVVSQKTIVVLEDEPHAAEMFAEMMRVTGYPALKCHSSAPAIKLIKTGMPDVVILDGLMPEVSGLEVLKLMRSEPQLAKIPVILVSAKSYPSELKTGMDAGASACLTKPVGFLDLKQTFEKVMALGGRSTPRL